MVLAEVAVGIAVSWNGHADAGRQQPMRLTRRVLRNHCEHNFPRLKYFNPCERGTSLHCGGKIDETRTKFCAAMPASRNASSKDVRRSRCLPTPLVKKIFLGTISLPNSLFLRWLDEGQI